MFTTTLNNISFQFQTNPTLFSPTAVDAGTLAMLSTTTFHLNDKVLDLGCGYGVVGILAGKQIGGQNIVMCDISETAIEYAKINAVHNQVSNLTILQSDGFQNISANDFTLILSNPPYHTDFSVAKHFIEDSLKHLTIGGRLIMVTKRLDWYRNKMKTVFGGVIVHKINGYYVFIAEKKQQPRKPKKQNQNTLSKKLKRKYQKKSSSNSALQSINI